MMSSQALNTVTSICIFTCFFSRIKVTITLSLFALTKKILHVNIRIQICVGVWVCIISFPSMHPFLLFIWASLQRGRSLISHSPLAMLRYYVHKNMNRIGDNGHPWWSPTPTGNTSYPTPSMIPQALRLNLFSKSTNTCRLEGKTSTHTQISLRG